MWAGAQGGGSCWEVGQQHTLAELERGLPERERASLKRASEPMHLDPTAPAHIPAGLLHVMHKGGAAPVHTSSLASATQVRHHIPSP